jgi:hypothetical protein
MFNATSPDGSIKTFSEGQVIAMVLDDLRKQIQLVIGRAAMIGDLRGFLRQYDLDP